jgi:hypothetical protein
MSRFTSHYVEPGTVYPDEPTVPVRPGWWVTNDAEDVDGHVEIYVEQANDAGGFDTREETAKRVATLLNQVS